MKKKFTILITAAVMLLTMMATTGEMWGQQSQTVTITMSQQGWSNATAIGNGTLKSAANTNSIFDYSSGTGDSNTTEGPKYYTSGSNVRFYVLKASDSSTATNGNWMQIDIPDNTTVTKIEITGVSSYTPDIKYNIDGGSDVSLSASSDKYTVSSISATSSFKFRNTNTSTTSNTQLRITAIEITYTTSGGGNTPSISANNVNIAYNATNGSIGYTLNNATGNVSASVTTGSDWLSLGTITSSAVPFTCSANTGAQRTATVTLSFTGAQAKVVTITQGAAPMTIAAAREQGTGSVVTRGVVTSCVGTTGYIQDNTAAICVYGASLTVGDEILVSGTLTTYKGLLEITSPQVTVLSQNNTVTPTVKTIVEINSDYGTNTLQGMLVKIENAIVTAISGSNTTISQTISNTTSTIIVRGISGVEYAVDDVFTELTGNIGAYDTAQIANPTNVVVKPTITTDATNSSLAVPDQILGLYDASDYATLKVSGNHLTAGITLNLGANSAFEMSTDLSSWSSTITIPQTNGSITNEEVAIRLKESLTVVQQYADNVTLTSTNAADVTIALTGNLTNQTFTIEQYSTPATAHGTITFAYEGPLYANTIVTLNAAPAAGYDFAGPWVFYKESGNDYVVDNSITVNNGNKITMPAYNLWVDATFSEKTKYAITPEVNPATSGTIVTDNTAWEGKTVEVQVEAEDGYAFSALAVTKTGDANTTVPVTGDATNGFTFEMPAYAVTVTATFAVQLNVTYDFTSLDNFYTTQGGSIHPSSGSSNSYDNLYYTNGDHIAFSGSSHYFYVSGSNCCFLFGKSGATVDLPTFTNYNITSIVIHSSSGGSTNVNVAIVSGNNHVTDTVQWSATDTDYTYNIPEAYQSSALSVKVTSNHNAQFTSITLVRAIPSTDPNIIASNVTVAYGETSGTINYTIQNPVSGNSVTASTSTSWIGSTFTYGDNQVGFTVTEQNNTATDRQGTITLIYGNNLATKEVTITQEHIVVEAPEFNPAGGSYTASQDVALSCTTAGATIYYTLDGTTPDNTSTAYTGTINVSTTTTIKAIAYVGEVASEVAEATYTIIEPFTPTVYTRATSITSGGHYIIVGFDNNNHDNAYAMGEQKTNNRGAVIISEDGTNASVINEDVYDFVISYVETVDETDYYSIYDADNGYLYAANSGKNWLMSENEVTDNSKWAIEIDATSGVASVVADLSTNRNVMQFNYASNNQLFSCYSTANQKPVYLYEKSTTVTPITNNTTVASTDFSATVPAGYRLIASPVNMLNPKAIDGMLTGNYDLYYFDENGKDDDELKEWRNYKAGNFLLESGKGYLYASESGVTLNFIGAPYTGTGEIELNYTAGNRLAGWNLIGNPYATASTLNIPFYKMNDNGDGFTAKIEDLTNTINAMEGVFVQATAANQTATFTAQTRGGNQAGIANANINVTNTSGSVIDNAIIRFDGGNALEKFSFREDNAKIYFKQDNKDYAVVKAEARGEMPVNFKTAENGTFTIDFSMDNVEFDYLHLIDNKTGMDVDLLQTPSYTFEASKIDYASRFRLVFSATNSNVDLGDDFGFFSNGSLMILGIDGEAILQMFDVTGRIINSETFSGSYNKAVNAKAGVYMIRLIQGENVRTQKIIVK